MANVADRICSWPENGTLPTEGLSSVGKDQVSKSANAFVAALTLPREATIKIVTSDFTRARETAEIILNTLQSLGHSNSVLIVDERLRERHFGAFEGESGNKGYPKVWDYDAQKQVYPGVESPELVAARALAVINDLSLETDLDLAVVVAHGDTLQILQTRTRNEIKRISPWEHRQLKHLETAEMRIVEF
ncbi:histidine phosphatase superfamily [Obelidium mucronatum]|nr:histidine phosphatase superfamily [Obelidium mucronatum]